MGEDLYWEILVGWGDVVRVHQNGRLMVGNPGRHQVAVILTPQDMRRLAKRLNKTAKGLES